VFTTLFRINAFAHTNDRDMASRGTRLGASSLHVRGANFCFADCSVRFISDEVDTWDLTLDEWIVMNSSNIPPVPPGVYQRLSTRDGGDNVDLDDL